MKTIFITLMLFPSIAFTQMREDLFEDIDISQILNEEIDQYQDDLYSENSHFALYYAKYKVAELSREMKNTKTTSIYLYQRGQLDAYVDIINYFERY